MHARLASFLLWAVVAASVVYWGMRLLVRAPVAPAHAVTALPSAGSDPADYRRLLGAAPVVAASAPAPLVAADNRLRLLGVVAPKGKNQGTAAATGLALISVDGKPARPYGVGAVVDANLVLISVGHRMAELGPQGGPSRLKLELAPLPEATRSNLPQAAGPPQLPTPSPAPSPMQFPAQSPPPVVVPPPGAAALPLPQSRAAAVAAPPVPGLVAPPDPAGVAR